jgi:hypothetical protein
MSRIDSMLHAEWQALVGDASKPAMAYVAGIIKGLYEAGALAPDERELWERRIEGCPGHEGEGGLVWCAYCGVIPVEAEEEASA